MKISSISSVALVLLSFVFPGTVSYSLTDTVIGSTFYKFFIWEAIGDPTHGRVLVRLASLALLLTFLFCLFATTRNYVDKATSIDSNLTFASSDTFILRGDYTSVLSPSGSGRDSVRIRSKKAYTNHVAVYVVHDCGFAIRTEFTSSFDIRHMPQGCGCVDSSIYGRIADEV
jgi:hypothetical protein